MQEAARAGVTSLRGRVPTPQPRPMSLFLDIGTGAGLASSTGVRPYLPPLLAGGLARGDIGIDFDGTDFSFLESTAFLAAVVAVGVVAFLARALAAAPSGGPGSRGDPWRPAGRRGARRAAVRGRARRQRPPGLDRAAVRPALRRCSAWIAVGRPRGAGAGTGSSPTRPRSSPRTRTARRSCSRRSPSSCRRSRSSRSRGSCVLLMGGRRREGEKYAGLRILR